MISNVVKCLALAALIAAFGPDPHCQNQQCALKKTPRISVYEWTSINFTLVVLPPIDFRTNFRSCFQPGATSIFPSFHGQVAHLRFDWSISFLQFGKQGVPRKYRQIEP
jgi:hypothetical protein